MSRLLRAIEAVPMSAFLAAMTASWAVYLAGEAAKSGTEPKPRCVVVYVVRECRCEGGCDDDLVSEDEARLVSTREGGVR